MNGRTISTRSTSRLEGFQLNIEGSGPQEWWLGYYQRDVELDSFKVNNTAIGFSDIDSEGYWIRWEGRLGRSRTIGLLWGYDRIELHTMIFPTMSTRIMAVNIKKRIKKYIEAQAWTGALSTGELPSNWFLLGKVEARLHQSLRLSLNAGIYLGGMPMAFTTFSNMGAITLFPYLREANIRNRMGQYYGNKIGFVTTELTVSF